MDEPGVPAVGIVRRGPRYRSARPAANASGIAWPEPLVGRLAEHEDLDLLVLDLLIYRDLVGRGRIGASLTAARNDSGVAIVNPSPLPTRSRSIPKRRSAFRRICA